jgi:hypothetical protein
VNKWVKVAIVGGAGWGLFELWRRLFGKGRGAGGFGLWLAAVHAKDWLPLLPRLPELWRAGFDGIDIRIAVPAAPASADERRLAAAVHASGGRVRCHGWTGRRSSAGFADVRGVDGLMQGRWLGARSLELSNGGKVELVSGNAERDVWRWPGLNGAGGYTANPWAVDFLAQFVQGVREIAPAVKVGDLGFANPAEHYARADQNNDGRDDTVIPAEVQRLFDRKGVMAYGDTESQVRPRLDKVRALTPASVPLSLWHSIGRIAPGGDVVGRAETTLAAIAGRWGGIDESVSYVGFTEKGQSAPTIAQVFEGHSRHISLVELAKRARGSV